MLVTKDLKRDKVDVRTKVFGNSLTDQDQKEEYVTFVEDKNSISASMMFPHVLIEDVENVLTVHLDKYVDFVSEVYKVSSDTYEKLVILCERFEESFMETGNMRSEVESDNSDDSETEMDNDVQNGIVDCADRTSG